MTRRSALIGLATLSAIALAPWPLVGRAGQQAPVFRGGTAVVSVDVAVRDKSRRTIMDLTPADFVVRDNGVVQEVDEISFGKKPIDVTIGLDVSGSVTGPMLEQLRRGVDRLMAGLQPQDRLKLILFNTTVQRAADFTTDVAAVRAAMRSVPAGGGTALYDTVSVALAGASDPERRHLVMVFTDGADSGGVTPASTLQTVAARSRATVSFVMSNPLTATMGPSSMGLFLTSSGTAGGPLARIAAETGGTVIQASTDPGSEFRRLLDEFRSTYVLLYTPRGVDREGFHAISVDVKRPNAVVQARRGYFGG